MSNYAASVLGDRLVPLYDFAGRLEIDEPSQAKNLGSVISSVELAHPAFSRLVGKLKAGLSERRWQSILVDIRSAELPSIVLRTITGRIAHDTHTQPPDFMWLATGKQISTELVRSQLRELDPGGRMLFFSEYLSKGSGLTRLVQSAVELDRDRFDVAAVNTDFPGSYYSNVINHWRGLAGGEPPEMPTEIYIGDNYFATEQFHNSLFQHASGIEITTYGGELTVNEVPVDPDLRYVAHTALQALGDVLYDEHFG